MTTKKTTSTKAKVAPAAAKLLDAGNSAADKLATETAAAAKLAAEKIAAEDSAMKAAAEAAAAEKSAAFARLAEEVAAAKVAEEAKAEAEAQAAAKAAEDAAAVPVLVVTGPKAGFRRAGRAFGPEPVRIPLSELSEGELEAIEGEPRLLSTIEDANV